MISERCKGAETTHVEVTSVDGFKVDGDRLLPRFVIVDVACTMRGQVCMTVLILGDLLPPVVALDFRSESRQPPTLHRDRRYPGRKAQSRPAKVLAAEQTSSRYDVETTEPRHPSEATVGM